MFLTSKQLWLKFQTKTIVFIAKIQENIGIFSVNNQILLSLFEQLSRILFSHHCMNNYMKCMLVKYVVEGGKYPVAQ